MLFLFVIVLSVFVDCFQNNNRGGYNAGDVDTESFQGDSEDDIYYMVKIITTF